MYSKTYITNARYHINFDPDSLLYQCKNVISLLHHFFLLLLAVYNVESVLLSCCPVGVTCLSYTKSGLAGSHRLMSSPDTCIGLRIYVSICGGIEHFIFRLMYEQFYLDLERQRSQRMFRYVDVPCLCLSICILKHTHTQTNIGRESCFSQRNN